MNFRKQMQQLGEVYNLINIEDLKFGLKNNNNPAQLEYLHKSITHTRLLLPHTLFLKQ